MSDALDVQTKLDRINQRLTDLAGETLSAINAGDWERAEKLQQEVSGLWDERAPLWEQSKQQLAGRMPKAR